MTHHGQYQHPIPPQQQRFLHPQMQHLNQAARYSVTYHRKNTAHLWHFILTICTAGLWLPVWLFLVIVRSKKQKNITRYY